EDSVKALEKALKEAEEVAANEKATAEEVAGCMESLKIAIERLVKDTSEFKITAQASIGGSIEPEGIIEVKAGENQKFTMIPEDGYFIKDVLVDG
ncbi:hypothetical protein RFZ45_09025, partial [Acinetobacter baumannii]|nr:hypothetical protein [Acinetobacter baumannii]